MLRRGADAFPGTAAPRDGGGDGSCLVSLVELAELFFVKSTDGIEVLLLDDCSLGCCFKAQSL
jgi:hypothetical protein